MALKLLLDEHISPKVAEQSATHDAAIQITSMQAWEDEAYLGVEDAIILRAAQTSGLTLVTYDVSTIGPLVKEWSETGETHAGIVFVDHRTIDQREIGGLVRAIGKLWERESNLEWVNRVRFLRA